MGVSGVSKLGGLCMVIFCLQGHVTQAHHLLIKNLNDMLMSIMGCVTSHSVT